LHSAAEFRACQQRGKRFADEFFSVSVLHNGETHPRLGLAIATRICGGSVTRNRLKRLTRESFRLHQHALPALDITVAARDAAARAAPLELRSSLGRLWQRIARKA
jgi:ribonuclease P protein component